MSKPLQSFTFDTRPRYAECDPMGYVHHAVYPIWMEMARTELLRASGVSYAELEQRGVYIVVARLNLVFKKPARYDEPLTVTAHLTRCSGAKIEHDYEIARDRELLVTASTTLACTTTAGRVIPVPDAIRIDSKTD